jgi:predicted NUDIX family NTP pyrophosphohydrolase
MKEMSMPKKSAGILRYRHKHDRLEVLLVHPGGPFWAKKDAGAWSIPKGEFEDGEDVEATARREFHEETGQEVQGDLIPLAPVKYTAGKIIHAFAVEGDMDVSLIQSNLFSMEWPPKSGRQQQFPEIDRGEWFDLSLAAEKINAHQAPLLVQLQALLKER